MRGPDWQWGEVQDGGKGNAGEVTGDVGDGWVSVKWLNTGVSNSYRAGADGKYDLRKMELNSYQRAMLGVSSVLVSIVYLYDCDI